VAACPGSAVVAVLPTPRSVAIVCVWRGQPPGSGMDDRNELMRELMAVFDELPAALREAINYAPEPLDPKDLATLCRRHGAANVLAMIELKLKRRPRLGSPDPKPP
jgi:hypothetical protein